jgi:hypothetical protein
MRRSFATAALSAHAWRLRSAVASVGRVLAVGIAPSVLLTSCAPDDATDTLSEYRLSQEPELTIGGDQTPETEFFRIALAWRLTSGGIAVVNRGSSDIRVFDARGRFLHAFGRTGEGPGEFRHIGWTAHFGDTAIVHDGTLRRITSATLEGTPRLVATRAIQAADEPDVAVVGRFADGSWMAYSLARPNMSLRGLQRIPARVGVLAAEAVGSIRWLLESPDLPVLIHSPDADSKMVSVVTAAFPASLVILASGETAWLGDATADTLVLARADGESRHIHKLPYAPDSLSREWIDTARSREIAAARDQASRDLVAVKYSDPFLPRTLPAFQAFIAGPDGEVWIQRPADSPATAVSYTIFAATGEARARVASTPGFRVTDAGVDFVVGVHRDSDGVETVRKYTLIRE